MTHFQQQIILLSLGLSMLMEISYKRSLDFAELDALKLPKLNSLSAFKDAMVNCFYNLIIYEWNC